MIKNKMHFFITLITGLCLLGIACMAYYFYHPHKDMKHTGFQGKASVNQFYAAEKMLNKLAVETRSRALYQSKNDDDADLLMMPLMSLPEGKEWADLQAQVADGATLITGNLQGHQTAEALPTQDLMDFFYLKKAQFVSSTLKKDQFFLGGQEIAVDVNIMNDLQLENEDDVEQVYKLGEKLFLYSFFYGNGRVWLVNDLSIFNNHNLEKEKHATLFWEMTKKHQKAICYFAFDHPSILKIMWRKAPAFVLLFCLALIIHLWHHSPRFGPKLEEKSFHRNRLLEHIKAAGLFTRRKGGYEAVLAPIRLELKEKMNRQYASYDVAIEHLEKEHELTAKEIQVALSITVENAHEFVEVFKLLKKLTGYDNVK